MRTSGAQFDMMVTYMEQHGDLSKPTSDPNGKIRTLRQWEQLTQLLNSDGSGDTKTTEKWKKVWSDYKNNIKKKAARIHRSAKGTGGGPANYAKLSDLEDRVLNLIGRQVATGLAVEEAGLSQRTIIQTERQVASPPPLNIDTGDINSSQSWNEPGPSSRPHIAPPLSGSEARLPMPFIIEEVEGRITPSDTNELETRVVVSPPQMFVTIDVQDTDMLTPSRNVSPRERDTSTLPQPALSRQTLPLHSSQLHVTQVQPTQSGQTTPRRTRLTRTRGSPRRRVRPAYTEQAAEHFLHSDEEWRKFKMEQHRDYMELRREQNRIRNSEIQVQRDWLTFASRTLDSLDKLVNKYCKE